VYGVSVIFAEKGSDSSNEQYDNFLKGINLEFKNFTSCNSRISDNNNVMGVFIIYSRNKANAYGY